MADGEVVARIYIDSWNAGFGGLLSRADRTVTPELIERWNHDLAQPVPHRWWVAEHMSSIVGFVGIGPSRDPVDPQLGELDTIAVDPPHWRTGIGKALISLALQHLVSDGYSEAIVWTAEGSATRPWGGAVTAGSEEGRRSALGETWLPYSENYPTGSAGVPARILAPVIVFGGVGRNRHGQFLNSGRSGGLRPRDRFLRGHGVGP